MKPNADVDVYLAKAKRWKPEIEELRAILLECDLVEELKWAKPCYTSEGKNIVLIVSFKPHCALLFTQGALLDDPKKILIRPTENTNAARQVRFADVVEIKKLRSALKGYVEQAIKIRNSGATVESQKDRKLVYPEEFQSKLNENPKLKAAFEALTPGRQRGYYLHFSGAKQSKTRASRVDKCLKQILAGKGMND